MLMAMPLDWRMRKYVSIRRLLLKDMNSCTCGCRHNDTPPNFKHMHTHTASACNSKTHVHMYVSECVQKSLKPGCLEKLESAFKEVEQKVIKVRHRAVVCTRRVH